jgi:hypothetical protein
VIEKLHEHNKCFKEVIKELEIRLKSAKDDLLKSQFSQSIKIESSRLNTASKTASKM